MKQKKSFFNSAVFRKNLKTYWPVWASYLLIYALVVLVFNRIESGFGFSGQQDFDDFVRGLAAYMGPVMSFGFSCISAMAVYSYLYNARSSNLFASLPIRRESMYLTSFLSALSWLIAVNLFVTLLLILSGMTMGVSQYGGAWEFFLMSSLQCIFFFGLASLIAMMTGLTLVLPVLYFLVSFAAVLLEFPISFHLQEMLYGFSFEGSSVVKAFSPLVNMLSLDYAETIFLNPDPAAMAPFLVFLIYALVGLAFALIGLLIYRVRSMENAGDAVAVPVLRPVIRFMMGVGCALLLGYMIYGMSAFDRNSTALTLFMIFFGFIGYFGTEMLIQKRFRVFRKWPLFAGLCALIILYTVSVRFDLLKLEEYVPKADQVYSVTLMGDSRMTFTDPKIIDETVRVHEQVLKEHQELTAQGREDNGEDMKGIIHVNLRYRLKNGAEISREYALYATEAEYADPGYSGTMYEKLVNNYEILRTKYEIKDFAQREQDYQRGFISYYAKDETGYYVYRNEELSFEDALDLYQNGIEKDLMNASIGQHKLIYGADKEISYAGDIELIFTSSYVHSFYYQPNLESVNTIAWLESHGYHFVLQNEYEEKAASSYYYEKYQ